MSDKLIQRLKQKCYKKFDADTPQVEQFAEVNQAFWKEHDKKIQKKDGEYIWIGMFMVEKWMTWMQPKFLFAKGLEEQHHYRTLVLDWEYNEKLEKIYQSYGFEFISMKLRMFQNVFGFLYGMVKAIGTFITKGTGHQLVGLTYKGRQIGQYIYDNTIRTKSGVYTLRNARNKMVFKKVLTSYWFLHTLNKVAKEYCPKIYIYDDLVYDEGMIAQFMHQKHVELMKCGVAGIIRHIPWAEGPQFWPDIYGDIVRNDILNLSEEEKKQIIAEATTDIEQRFLGNNGDVREAQSIFKNKQECTVEELKQIMGLHQDRKTVVIFAHCLSENPHKCSIQLYDDSFTWLDETLKYVRELDNVNWVLKGHPIAAAKYGETGVMEAMFEKYKNDNLFWFPNEYNSALTTQLADAVVTVYGTAGAEYTCLGIPVVHTGKAFYANFGYTEFPQTIDEYHNILRNIHKLQPLTEEQKNMAKLVFVCNNRCRKTHFDDYDDRMNELDSLFYQDLAEHKTYETHNHQTFQAIMDYMDNNDILRTVYYQNGVHME